MVKVIEKGTATVTDTQKKERHSQICMHTNTDTYTDKDTAQR